MTYYLEELFFFSVLKKNKIIQFQNFLLTIKWFHYYLKFYHFYL